MEITAAQLKTLADASTLAFTCSAEVGTTAVAITSAPGTLIILDIGIITDPVDAAFLVNKNATLWCKIKLPSGLTTIPSVKWWKVDSPDKQISNANTGYVEATGVSTLTFTSATMNESGTYKCEAVYSVNSVEKTVKSATAELYIRELSVTLDATVVVETLNGANTFTCEYHGDNNVQVGYPVWTYKGTAVSPAEAGLDEGTYNETTKKWETTYEIAKVEANSGGEVKCEFQFTVGDPITSTTSFLVRTLTDVEAKTISGDATAKVTCEYFGTDNPDAVKWYIDSIEEVQSSKKVAGEFASFTRKDQLIVSERTNNKPSIIIKCEFLFTTPTATTLSQTTTLIYRGINKKLPGNSYSIGSQVSLTCSVGVDSAGEKPSATTWTKNEVTVVQNIGYNINIPAAVTTGEFISTLVLGTVNSNMEQFAGIYKCDFTFTADSAEYSSEGVVDARLVTITPAATPASPHVSFNSTEQTIVCTLSQTDSTSFEVKWSHGVEAINSGVSTTGMDSTLTLKNPNTANDGLYTCQFVFVDTNSPMASTTLAFSILKMSPEVIYSTHGAGVTITLSCEVASSALVELVFVESGIDITGTTPIFGGGKTNLNHTIVVSSYAADKVYSCKNSNTSDVAPETTTHKILQMTAKLNEKTRKNKDETVSLTCATDWNDVIKKPKISWLIGSTKKFVSQTAPVDKSKTQSILEVSINDQSDGETYKCTILYYDLVNGGSYESSTEIIMNKIVPTTAAASVEKGVEQVFVCTATADNTVELLWRKETFDSTLAAPKYESFKADNISTEAYDNSAGTQKSTLTLAGLATIDSSDSIECYDKSINISAVMSLTVVDSVPSGGGDVINLEAATVTCTYSGLLTVAEVTWSGGNIAGAGIAATEGNFIVVQGNLSNAGAPSANTQVTTLTINKAEMKSQANETFTCSITLDAAQFTNTQKISVYNPEIKVSNLNFEFSQSDAATLTCILSNILSDTAITWNNGNTAVSNTAAKYTISSSTHDDSLQTVTSTMEITAAQLKTLADASTLAFTCSAEVGTTAVAITSTTVSLQIFTTETSFAVTTNFNNIEDPNEDLTCVFKGDDLLSDISWTGPNNSVIPAAKVEKLAYSNGMMKSTFKFTEIGETDGGDYSCTFVFKSGRTSIKETTDFVIFYLVDIEDYYLSPEFIEVTFKGTLQPTIEWLVDGFSLTSAVTDLIPSESVAWASNTVTFKLTNSRTSYATFTLQAKLTFSASAEVVATTAATVYKRELTTSLSGSIEIGPLDAGIPATFTCAADGEDNTKFAFTWDIGMTTIAADGLLLLSSATFTDEVTAGSLNERTSVLTITENNEVYNGILKCVATWSDISLSVDSETDVMAVGARMDQYTFDTGSGEAVLSCVVWGDSAPFSVEWIDEDDAAITNEADKIIIANTDAVPVYTHTLTIKKLTFGDQGNYTCKVVFVDGGADKSLTTTVMKLSASFDPASPLFVHDNTIEFTCTYTGIEDPEKIEWYTGDKAIAGSLIEDGNAAYTIVTGDFSPTLSTKSSVFKVNSPSVASSGDYTCKWVLPAGSQFDPSQTMTVAVRSLTIVAPTTTSLDGNIALTCTFEGLAEGDMKWYLDNVVIESDAKNVIANTELISNTADFTLKISEVNPEDNAGTYQCRMTFEDTDEITASSEVTVRKASVISTQGDVVSTIIVSADVLTAKCLMEGDEVPNDVEWYAGSTKITFDGTTKIMNTNTKQLDKSIKYFSNITLKEFKFADSDTYRCVFKFDDATETEASVTVDFATVANVGCVSLDYLTTTDVTLTCTYNGKAAATGVTFTLPDSTTKAGTLGGFTAGASPAVDAGSQDGTYTLSGVTNDMDGSYSCEFTIDSGATLSAFQQLTARKTEITTSIGSLTLKQIVRSTVTLTCSVAGGAKEIKWYKGATELGNSDYKKVSTASNSDDLVSAIKLTIADDSAGTYTCEAMQYDDICSDEQKFPSAGVILEVIAAVPIQEPLSGTVYEGANHDLTCEFPNPFGDATYEIVWSFDGKPMTGGNVYYTGTQIIDGTIVNENAASTIKSSLSITKISKDAAGSYTCTIKWKTVYIISKAAVLEVPHISVPPSTTNVVSGSAAVFTCAVTADTAATSINLHQSSDDAIVGTPETATSGTTVTSLITLLAVTSAYEGDYYCKATWAAGTIRSGNVYLSVLELKSTEIETEVWGVADKMAEFECKSDAMLMKSIDDAYLDEKNKQKVYAEIVVSWTFSIDGTIWKPISDESRFVEKSPLIGGDGVQVDGLYIKGITAADEVMSVKCEIAYTDDAANHFIGGAVESVAIALKIASITSFSISEADPIAGDTITFTCVATGKDAPNLTFEFDESRFQFVSKPEVASIATTHTAEYITKTITANPTGQKVKCMADYGLGKGKDTEIVTVKTFYDCNVVLFEQLGDNKGTITATPGLGALAGSLTQTVECPAATQNAKYLLAAATENAGPSITCNKSTGRYTPEALSPCEAIKLFSTGFKEQTLQTQDLKACEDNPDNAYSKDAVTAILHASYANCGFYPRVPCLMTAIAQDSCTLNTDKTTCFLNEATGKTHIQLFVDFTTPTFSIATRSQRVNFGAGTIQFWSCTNSRKRRGASEIDYESLLYQQTNETVSQSGDTDDSPPFVIAGTAAATCAVAIIAVFTYLVLYRRQKKAVHFSEVTQHTSA